MRKIYLAIPYNDENSTVRESRFKVANQVAAKLMNSGDLVFSPISHSHPIAEQCDLPKGYNFWKRWNESFVRWCDRLYVITIDGWEESTGVQDEIALAKSINVPVVFVDGEGNLQGMLE